MSHDTQQDTALGVDIGGTKTLAGLVAEGHVLARDLRPTARDAGADDWMAATAGLAQNWPGRFGCAGVAVTGVVADGLWSPLNPGILNVPPGFPLVARLEQLLGVPVLAVNDAQAAAWGEFRHGAGRGTSSLVFATVSTGLGGGVIVDGKLVVGRRGVAGSLGQLAPRAPDAVRMEDTLSGQWMAWQAAADGHDLDAAGVLAAADAREDWAEHIVGQSVERLSTLLADLHYLLDPDRIIIGGGLGLRPTYLDRLRARVAATRTHAAIDIVPAALGADAGIVGAADLAAARFQSSTMQPEPRTEESRECAH